LRGWRGWRGWRPWLPETEADAAGPTPQDFNDIEKWRDGWEHPMRHAPDDYPALGGAGLWWWPVIHRTTV
jgi:hypothetical protein